MSTTAEEEAQWQKYYAQNKTVLGQLHSGPSTPYDELLDEERLKEYQTPNQITRFLSKGGRKHRSVKRSGRKGRKISRRKTRKNSSRSVRGRGRKITRRRKTIRRRKTHRRKTVRR